MANGTTDDVLRSLRRYVAQTLGSPPWTVRTQRTRVADDERPVAVVEQSSPLSTSFSRARTLHQGDVQKMVTFTVVAYPGPIAATAAEAREQADAVAQLLDDGFSRGLVSDDDPPKLIGAPWAFPLFDFDGVPIVGSSRAGPDEPYSYAFVNDRSFGAQPIQDAIDELRFTVVASVRVSWWRGGRWIFPAPTAERMPGVFLPVRP